MKSYNIYKHIFGYLEETREEAPKLFDFVISVYKKQGTVLLFFRPILRLFSTNKIHFKYLFWGTKFPELIKSLPKGEVGVFGGLSHFLFCLKNNIPYFELCFLDYEIYKIHKNFFNKDRLIFLIDDIVNILKKHKIEYIVLENDGLPLQRLLILAAKKNGIKIICIQHGLLLLSSSNKFIYGKCSDVVLTYDYYQKSIFASSGIKNDKIRVLGPTTNFKNKNNQNYDRKNICILGQPWGNYRNDIFIGYLKIIYWLYTILVNNNYNVIFKPHPKEIHKKYSKIFKNIYSGNLDSCFKKYDIFISFTSTALYEATINEKISIQIFDKIFHSDRFDIAGYAHSVNSYDENMLINIISTSNPIKIKSINDDFYELDISNRFKSALSEQ